MRAVAEGADDVAVALLEAGADVRAADADGWAALHFAALHRSAAIARVLLARGADLGAKTRRTVRWAEEEQPVPAGAAAQTIVEDECPHFGAAACAEMVEALRSTASTREWGDKPITKRPRSDAADLRRSGGVPMPPNQ